MTTYLCAQPHPGSGPPMCCGAPMRIDPELDEATCDRCGGKLSGQTGERTPALRGWKLTIRTAPGHPVASEYECPVHGRFALDVPRGEDGDPPGEVVCSHRITAPVIYVDGSEHAYLKVPEYTTHCGRPSPHVISATGIARVRKVEAIRGGYQKAERETWTDTTNLGEGQDLDDWKADRAKVWERENERQAMELAREL